MTLGTILATIAALSALGYLFFCAKEASALRSFLKTISVALLGLAAWMAGAPMLLVLALLLCALGDFFLSREGEEAFMAGVGAFAAGHLAYVVLFLRLGESELARLFEVPIALFALLILVIGGAMMRILAPKAGELKFAVLAYIPIILSMGLAALSIEATGALLWILPAALAFMVSDIVLAFETFVLAEDHWLRRWTPYAVWPLYWGAQGGFFLAFS